MGNPVVDSENSVINFIDELNKQRRYQNAIDDVQADPVIKARRLEDTKKDGVNTCLNSIFTKVCQDSIPEINGRTASVDDLDKVVADYISRRTNGNDATFYVKEAIKKNKNASVMKNILESVEKIVSDQYRAKSMDPDSITEEDYTFKITPEIDDKLTTIIRDNNLDDLSDVIKDNVRDTAISEVELAKKEKEDRQKLEEELTNDESITSENDVEEAVRARGLNKTSVYTPSLFESVMIHEFNKIAPYQAVTETCEYTPIFEGVFSNMKEKHDQKLEDKSRDAIANKNSEFLATVDEMYKAVYTAYRASVSKINTDKLTSALTSSLSASTTGLTVKATISTSKVREVADAYEALSKTMFDSIKYQKYKVPKGKTQVYSIGEAIGEFKKDVKLLDDFFKEPDGKKFVNKANAFVVPKANKCTTPKEVVTIYQIAHDVYMARMSVYSAAISFIESFAKTAEDLIKKGSNTEAKESAFDNAVVEYTLLNMSKALYLESFHLHDVDELARDYAKKY